jgi:DNA-binding transcriptional MerR regulator
LQYYDEKGLLVPSEYSEWGRRMYSRRDIIRLQQFVFLKSMGFSLEEIRDRMLPAESAAELEQLFIKQKEILLEEISHIQETVNFMGKIIDEIKRGSEIDIDRLLIIVRAIQKGHPYSFMFRYINKNQMEYFFNCIENEEAADKLNKSFQGISEELVELCRKNEKPEGLKGQEVASRWWNLMMSLTKGDTSFFQDLAEAVKNQRDWQSDVKEFNEATMLFLRRAIITYLKNNNIELS